MLPGRVTPFFPLGKDISGIQLQMSIAEGIRRGYVYYRCLITLKKSNSLFSINRYNY